MSEYTPSMDRIGDMYSWATGWRTEDRDEDTDLSENRRVMRAEFDRALAAHDADVRKPLEYRIAEDGKRALRTLELDREFLQQVADSYGIRTDEVTAAFLARQSKERAGVRKAALAEAAQIAESGLCALVGCGNPKCTQSRATAAAIRAAALGDAPTGGQDSGEVSDGYHTFNELYEYRMLYNAHAALGWFAAEYPVVKSWRHSDGELCFGGGWFIVSAQLPSGQVTNHYEADEWSLFDVPEVDRAPEWDGHTPVDVATRLRAALTTKEN